MNQHLKNEAYGTAARLARGDDLGLLYIRCDKHKRLNSTTVYRELESISEGMRRNASVIKKLIDKINELEKLK